MAADTSGSLSRALRLICWLPVALLLGIELYLQNFDGWGAWGAAPLLLLPALVSLPIVTLGLSGCLAAIRGRRPVGDAAVLTLIAALPIFWLAIRRFVR